MHVLPYSKDEDASLEARFTLHRLYEIDNKGRFPLFLRAHGKRAGIVRFGRIGDEVVERLSVISVVMLVEKKAMLGWL